ncbi:MULTISPECIES: methyl-accepting chemotaxis protein [Clostridium]|uniref:Methyl-accepting chemotaxis protein McpB n=2 Tax=Clostridium TaxID=1485 RepID=D8GUM2_CLOLD|nr:MULTISPECIES: CHASE3 domain-containing protein [Clostridium]ADK16899.1 predicted membrane-bound methyl-accepting chemotaxis protein [Clostridium ljungdahlii DSM 13528]OAA85278.1 Methyl-accepting chemotaxis protein McpB [Clostridium ljungdahlii DSM 13528]RMD04388.1 HAMP domain-containing protein [Clostridium autoethanogenum]
MLNKLKIGTKLYLGFGVITLIMILVLSFSYKNLNTESQAVDWNVHTYQVIGEADNTLESLVNIETGLRGYAITGKDTFLEPYNQGKIDFQKHIQEIKELTSDNPKQQQRIDALSKDYQDWSNSESSSLIATRQKVNSGKGNITDVINFEASQNGKKAMDDMRKLISDIQQEERSLLAQRTANLKITERNTKTVIVGGGVIGLILAIFLALIISRNIINAVEMLTLKLSNIAEAEGDLTQKVELSNKDELGLMAQKFNLMLEKTRKSISQVSQSSNILNEKVSTLSVNAEEVSKSSDQMASTVEEMAVGNQEIAKEVSSVSSMADNINKISKDTSVELNSLVENRKLVEKIVYEGQNIIKNQTTHMNQTVEISKEVRNAVEGLVLKTDSINKIAETINGIAEQTNLLALNAAIEAARAGEHGKGFTVVAEEVKELAELSLKSTGEVFTTISEIQTAVGQTVKQIKESEMTIYKQEEATRQTQDSFTQINEQINDMVSKIESMSSKISKVIEQVGHLNASLQNVSAITEESASSAEEVSASMEEQALSITKMASLATALNDLSIELQKNVNLFKY